MERLELYSETTIFRGENRIFKSLKPKVGRLFETIQFKVETDSMTDKG